MKMKSYTGEKSYEKYMKSKSYYKVVEINMNI